MIKQVKYNTLFLSFYKVSNIYKLVMKYIEFVGIFKSESNLLIKTDIDAWKCGYRLGLETLLAHTVNDEY